MGYIDDAIASGIPIEQINSFLSNNPGDESRLLSALGGSNYGPSGDSGVVKTSVVVQRSGDRAACMNAAIAAGIPMEAIEAFLSGNPGDECRILPALGPDYGKTSGIFYIDPNSGSTMSAPSGTAGGGTLSGAISSLPPELIASIGAPGTLTEAFANPTSDPQGFGDILKGIVGAIPVVGDIIAGFLPGGQQPRLPPVSGGLPRLPGGTTPPVVVLPPTTSPRPMPRFPRQISTKAAAAIAAAAAALGITAEQYIAQYGVPRSKIRKMNQCNVKALNRATRRMDKFECWAKKVLNFNAHSQIKRPSARKRGRGCRKGCAA